MLFFWSDKANGPLYLVTFLVLLFFVVANFRYRNKPYSFLTKQKLVQELSKGTTLHAVTYSYFSYIMILAYYVIASSIVHPNFIYLCSKYIASFDVYMVDLIVDCSLSIFFILYMVHSFRRYMIFKTDILIVSGFFGKKIIIPYSKNIKVIFGGYIVLSLFMHETYYVRIRGDGHFIHQAGVANAEQLGNIVGSIITVKQR